MKVNGNNAENLHIYNLRKVKTLLSRLIELGRNGLFLSNPISFRKEDEKVKTGDVVVYNGELKQACGNSFFYVIDLKEEKPKALLIEISGHHPGWILFLKREDLEVVGSISPPLMEGQIGKISRNRSVPQELHEVLKEWLLTRELSERRRRSLLKHCYVCGRFLSKGAKTIRQYTEEKGIITNLKERSLERRICERCIKTQRT